MTAEPARITVVVATRNRRDAALATVRQLRQLPDRPAVVLVDNGSTDGTADAARAACPDVEVVALPRNRGAAGRNAGVARARTSCVAFADDDSGWLPGALTAAAGHFDRFPRLGLLAARILVGPERQPDPVSEEMAASRLPPERDFPGPSVLGFLACGAVVRRSAFLEVGGFSPVLHFLGEERLLALDLAGAGWGLAYAGDVVAEHHPGRVTREPDGRRRRHARNDLLTAWLRRPARLATRETARLAARGWVDPAARGALLDAARLLPELVAGRRPAPAWLEEQVRTLEATGG